MTATRKTMSGGMRLALDLGPLLLFFLANAKVGIFAATGIFIAAIVVAMVVSSCGTSPMRLRAWR